MKRRAIVAAAAAVAIPGALADIYHDVSFDLSGDIGRSASEVMSGWSLEGDATLIDSFVRLTEDQQHKKGVMSARRGAYELGDQGWTTDITFRVHGVGVSLAGDGLGMWYTHEAIKAGNLLGGPNRFHGLFLGLDTYINSPDSAVHQHPYLGIAVNDGSELATHDAVGIHTSLHAPAGCSITQARQIGPHESRVVTLRVQYGGFTSKWLNVKYVYGHGVKDYTHTPADSWTQCAHLEGIELPNGYYWGASAATGAVSDNHDVISIVVHRGSSDPAPAAGAPSPAALPETYQYNPEHPVLPPEPQAEPQQQQPPQQQVDGGGAAPTACPACPKQPIVVRPEMQRECPHTCCSGDTSFLVAAPFFNLHQLFVVW